MLILRRRVREVMILIDEDVKVELTVVRQDGNKGTFDVYAKDGAGRCVIAERTTACAGETIAIRPIATDILIHLLDWNHQGMGMAFDAPRSVKIYRVEANSKFRNLGIAAGA